MNTMLIRWFVFVLVLIVGQTSFANAQGQYYHLGKEQLQFSIAADSTQEMTTPDKWREVFDTDGRQYQVKKKPLIDANDIEGIAVEPLPSDPKDFYTITVYFKKESWDRISDETEKIVGKKLAVIRNHKLFSVPRVQDAIDTSAGIGGRVDSARLATFVDGLTPAASPDKSVRSKEYLSWVERRLASNKDVLAHALKVVNLCMYGSTKDYARAVHLLELIVQKKPSQVAICTMLGMCYAGHGKTEKAIEVFEKVITMEPRSEWAIRSQMAELYFTGGEKKKAIEQMNVVLGLLKKANMLGVEGVGDSLERRLQEMKAAKE